MKLNTDFNTIQEKLDDARRIEDAINILSGENASIQMVVGNDTDDIVPITIDIILPDLHASLVGTLADALALRLADLQEEIKALLTLGVS